MSQYFTIHDSTVIISHLILSVPVDEACNQINDFIKSTDENSFTTIMFNYKSEGFQCEIINHMNGVVKKLVTEFGYDLNMFLYHTGACSIDSNLKLYNILPFDFLPKNILLDSTILEGPFYTKAIDRKVVIKTKPKKFLSMNGMPRSSRRLAISWLIEQDLIKESFYSLDIIRIKDSYPESLLEKYNNVVVDSSTNLKEPMVLTKNFEFINNDDRIKQEDVYYFDNSYFSLVQETFYDSTLHSNSSDIGFYECIFISEKTYRPIYFKHPFIILGVKGSLAGLRERGYKTFSPYFDESYDDIADPVLRFEAVMKEVKRLCTLTDDEWLAIQRELLPIVEYNYNMLSAGNTSLLGKRE